MLRLSETAEQKFTQGFAAFGVECTHGAHHIMSAAQVASIVPTFTGAHDQGLARPAPAANFSLPSPVVA
ncbi:MAG: hypothetical protein ACK4VI_07215 [Alphaproteobacteria bacterium]